MRACRDQFTMRHTDSSISWESAYREYQRYCEEHRDEVISFDEWKENIESRLDRKDDYEPGRGEMFDDG